MSTKDTARTVGAGQNETQTCQASFPHTNRLMPNKVPFKLEIVSLQILECYDSYALMTQLVYCISVN